MLKWLTGLFGSSCRANAASTATSDDSAAAPSANTHGRKSGSPTASPKADNLEDDLAAMRKSLLQQGFPPEAAEAMCRQFEEEILTMAARAQSTPEKTNAPSA